MNYCSISDELQEEKENLKKAEEELANAMAELQSL